MRSIASAARSTSMRLRCRRHSRDPRHGACGSRARAQCALACLADRGNRKAWSHRDAERGEFRADPLPRNKRQDSKRGRCFPHQARTHPAPGRRYKLPNALRISVGTEEANRLVVQALKEFLGRRHEQAGAFVQSLGSDRVGLIGSSIARAARAQGAARTIVATARSPKTRRRVAELGIADQVVETNAAAVEGADLVIVCIPVGACGAVARRSAASCGRRHRFRRRLGKRRGRARYGAASAEERALHSGTSCRRHRIFRPRRRLCRSCSSTGGASSPPRKGPTPRR